MYIDPSGHLQRAVLDGGGNGGGIIVTPSSVQSVKPISFSEIIKGITVLFKLGDDIADYADSSEVSEVASGGGSNSSMPDPDDPNNKKDEDTDDVDASTSKYIPRDADGNPIPLSKQTVNGQDIPLPDPNASGPHTTLGGTESSKTGEVYLQSATFPEGTWPSANGENVPWSEVHWYNHGRSDHTNPHQHIFDYDWDYFFWRRQGPSPYLK